MYHPRYRASEVFNTFIPTSDIYFQPRYLFIPVQPGGASEVQLYSDMLRAIDRGQARVRTTPSGDRAGLYWGMNIDRNDLNSNNRMVQLFREDINYTRQFAVDIDAQRRRMGNGQNGYGNGRANGHANGRANGHGNSRSNGQGNSRSNGHANGRTNGHGGPVNGYTNGHGRGHGNGNRNGVNGYGRGYY